MKTWKRTAAGLLLACGIAVAAPSIASADTLVHQSANADGTHTYINANTGLIFNSTYYLGKTFNTSCSVIEQ